MFSLHVLLDSIAEYYYIFIPLVILFAELYYFLLLGKRQQVVRLTSKGRRTAGLSAFKSLGVIILFMLISFAISGFKSDRINIELYILMVLLLYTIVQSMSKKLIICENGIRIGMMIHKYKDMFTLAYDDNFMEVTMYKDRKKNKLTANIYELEDGELLKFMTFDKVKVKKFSSFRHG